MKNCLRHRFFQLLPAITLVAIGVCFAVASYYVPLIGDDRHYHDAFVYWDTPWRQWATRMHFQWLHNNSRLGDMLNPLLLNLMSAGVRAVANGLAVALFFLLAGRCAHPRHGTARFRDEDGAVSARMALTALILFALPWSTLWMEFVCFFNYVWASALMLLCLWLIFCKGAGRLMWLLVPLCFIAGGMHEALGLPVAIALGAWLCVPGNFRSMSPVRRICVAAIVAGALFSVSSPANLDRAGVDTVRELVMTLVFGSAYFVVALVVASGWFALRRPEMMRRLVRTDWLVYALAALFSTAFLLLAGFGGRPGWFAQLFALVALARLPWPWPSGRLARGMSLLLAVMVISHVAALAYWQKKLGSETARVIELYIPVSSSDGVVFFDYTPDEDLPWYLFRRVHGVPDSDDGNYLSSLQFAYGDKEVPLIILPSEASGIDFATFTGTRRIGRGILSSAPLSGRVDISGHPSYPRMGIILDGTTYVETAFTTLSRTLYFYFPQDPDPGQK